MSTDLHDALAELATTMTANPQRLHDVRRRAARRRRHRVAAGAAVTAGAAAVSLVAVRATGGSTPATPIASEVRVQPDCADVPAPPKPAPTDAVKTALPGAATAAETLRYKGTATIRTVDDQTLTIIAGQGGPAAAGDVVTAAADDATILRNGSAPASLSDLAPGETVTIAITVGHGGQSDHLDFVDLESAAAKAGPVATDKPADATVAPDYTVTASGRITAKGVVDSAADGVMRVNARLDGLTLALVVVHVDANTRYSRFGTDCANPSFAAGTAVGFEATANGDGSFTATQIYLGD